MANVWENRELNVLVGKTVRGIDIDRGHSVLVVYCDEGIFAFETVGDCCSTSWIEHVENAGSRGLVVAVVDRDMPNWEEGDDYFRSYGFMLVFSDAPPLSVEYRNRSNGYYGGSIDSLPLDAVVGSEMVPLREDF